MTMNLTWKTDDLTLGQCAELAGVTPAELEAVVSDPTYANHAECMAHGAWTANDREAHARYKSLARLARGWTPQPQAATVAEGEVVAWKEREAKNPATGAPGTLRDEWRVRTVEAIGEANIASAFGEDWRRSRPYATHVLEHRYIRRGFEEPWRCFEAANDRRTALGSIDGGAKTADPELVDIQAKRAQYAAEQLAAAEAERAERAEAEVAKRRADRSAEAFRRLAASPRDGVWAERWTAFVTKLASNEAVRSRIQADRALYDAALTAETVPAKRKAIKAFLAAFDSVEGGSGVTCAAG